MKKLVCFLLVVALAFPSLMVFADTTEIVESPDVVGVDAADVLRSFGVADIDYDELTSPMSRREFAKYVSIIGGYAANTEAAEEDDYNTYIDALVSAKIVSEGGADFEPDRQITMYEAIAMLVRTLDYDYPAEASGGYPTGYMNIAKRLDLFDKTGGAEALVTKGVAAQLLVNALNTEVMKTLGFSEGNEILGEVEGYTLAYRTFGILHLRDVVDAVDITALKGENVVPMYHIGCGGVEIYYEQLNPRDYLGYEADIYYTERRADRRLVLKHIAKTDRNNVTEISVANIRSINFGSIEYYEGDKEKKINISPVVALVYNGAASAEPLDMASLDGMSGNIRILDNDSDGRGDVIFANLYTDYVVSAVEPSAKLVFDRYDKTKNLVLDTMVDDPYTIIFDKNGKEQTLAKIKKDYVLSVYEARNDANQRYIEVRMSGDIAEGIVEKLQKTGNETILMINGKEYVMTESCYDNCGALVKPGMKITALLNQEGYIAGINFGDAEMMYGYITNATVNDEPFVNNIKLRIFTVSGEFIALDTAKTFAIDDISYQGAPDTAFTHLNTSAKVIYPNLEAGIYTQPIRYKINNEGLLTYIDTICKDNLGTLAYSKDVLGKNALYRIGSYSSDEHTYGLRYNATNYGNIIANLGGKFAVSRSSLILACPSPTNNEDDYYQMLKLNYFIQGVPYFAEAYTDIPNSMAGKLILIKNSTDRMVVSVLQRMGVIESVGEALVDGEVMKTITVMGEGGRVEYRCPLDFTFTKKYYSTETSTAPDSIVIDNTLPNTLKPDDLKPGDIVRIKNNQKGTVAEIHLLYRIEDGQEKGKHSGFEINRTHSWAAPDYRETDPSQRYMAAYHGVLCSGYVVRKADEGFMILRTETPGKLTNYNENLLDFYTYSNCIFVVYDTQARGEQKAQLGTAANLFAYDDVGEEYSRVLVQSTVSCASIVFIVK